jgi:hypothetical protein
MAMNLWECAHPGCKSKAVGSGGAIGLRAIGWYFIPAKNMQEAEWPRLFCPAHRPDPVRICKEKDGPMPCPTCKAEEEAHILQAIIYRWFGIEASQ